MTAHAQHLPPGPVDLDGAGHRRDPRLRRRQEEGQGGAGRARRPSSPTSRSGCGPRVARPARGRRVLLVLQGMDTSGKGGVLKHTVGLVDPQGVRITSFKAPTEEELAHDFLWRIRRAAARARLPGRLRPLPLRGRADRPGRGAREPRGDRARYDAINEFERELVDGRDRGAEVHAAHQQDDPAASGCWPGWTTRRSTGSTSPATSTRGRAGTTTARRTGSRSSGPTPSTRRGTSYPATTSGSATSPSARCCSTPCAAWTWAGRRPTSTWTQNGPGCSRRTRAPDPFGTCWASEALVGRALDAVWRRTSCRLRRSILQWNLPRRGAGRTTVKRAVLVALRSFLNFLNFLPCFLKTVILTFLAGLSLPLKPARLPDDRRGRQLALHLRRVDADVGA